jgi:hypothetical protein
MCEKEHENKIRNTIYDLAYLQHTYMLRPRASEVKWTQTRRWLAGVAPWEACWTYGGWEVQRKRGEEG